MTDKTEADIVITGIGILNLIAYYFARKYDYAPFNRIGFIVSGIMLSLIGILDIIFG
jgi:hypothetical protein